MSNDRKKSDVFATVKGENVSVLIMTVSKNHSKLRILRAEQRWYFFHFL